MKTVFTNDMVAHVWAQQNQEYGRSNNGNFYFEGAALYSYGRHFTCARFTAGVVLFNTASYSVTTAQHMSLARRAASHYDGFGVENPDAETKAEHAENYKKLLAAYETTLDQAARARADSWKANQPQRAADHLNRYAKHFKLGKRAVIPPDAEALAERKRKLNTQAAKQAAETKKRNAEARKQYAEEIAAWRDSGRGDYAYPGPYWLKPTPADKQARDVKIWERTYAEDYRAGAWTWGMRDYVKHATQWDKEKRAEACAEIIVNYCAGAEIDLPKAIELTEAQRQARAEAVAPQCEQWANGAIDRLPHGAEPTEAQILQRHGAELAQWRACETRYISSAIPGAPFMRINGDNIETSQHASFPVADAVRAWPLIKRIKRAGKIWQRNGETIKLGHFQIDRIDASGNVRAGCHFVQWKEIEKVAAELGLS